MERGTEELREHILSSGKTVAVTGSGISYLYGVGRLKRTMGGRSAVGGVFSPDYVKRDPEGFYSVMRDAFLDATFVKGPSPVHRQLAQLEKKGYLQGIVTQNLDCLHQAAGSTNVAEIQGGFDDNVCVDCGTRVRDYTVWNTGKAPRCPSCGGPIMPFSFCRTAKGNREEAAQRMDRAADMLSDAELVIIMGTTGFMSDQYMARLNRNAFIVQINPSATVFDSMADVNIRAEAQGVLDEILKSI